jgi:Arylsulfotransferase (ASST).
MIRSLLLLLLFTPGLLQARIIPAEGSVINYRLAGFTASSLGSAQYYRLQIAKGIHHADKDFEKNIIISVEDTSRQMIQLLPEFGKSYTWRISSLNTKNSKKALQTTPLYHFATGAVPEVDTSKNRLRILNAASLHKDMLLITDNMAVIYNMLGEPVWYLPELKDASEKNMRYRDLKPTAFGTFTALCSDGIYEFDYQGNILWRGPLNKTPRIEGVEYYHHDFTRLHNGHYMVLTNELLKKSQSAGQANNKDSIINVVAGAIVEYDSTGKIVWQWSSSDKFTDEEYFSIGPIKGKPGPNTHMNGFWFDDKSKEVYISFRNINTVMKISYPSGRVICRYGFDKPYFKGQHTPTLSSDGELFLFNNNTTARELGGISYVTRFAINGCNLDKQWEFGCDIDTTTNAGTMIGGSAAELPDGNMLVCVGNTGRIFIVSRQKQVVWNAVAENKLDGNEQWVPSSEYRTGFIEMAQLPEFIFRGK